jgi:hypothetical protein
MKRLLLLTLVLSTFVTGVLVVPFIPLGGNAKEAKGSPAMNEFFCADANGDGVVNMADPIAILKYLFLSGEAPYCIAEGCSLTDAFVTREELEEQLRGLRPPESLAMVELGAMQMVPSDNWDVKVRLNRVLKDALGEFDTRTNRFIAASSGTFLVNAEVWWSPPSRNTNYRADIVVNDKYVATGIDDTDSDWHQNAVAINWGRVIDLEAGDTVEVRVVQWTGRDQQLSGGKLQIVQLR